VHGWAFAAIQHPELNPGGINCLTHQSTQRINLSHNLTLGNASDGRIAGHLPHRVEIGGQQSGAGTYPGSSGRCFGTRMSGSDHDDVVLIAVTAHGLLDMVYWTWFAGHGLQDMVCRIKGLGLRVRECRLGNLALIDCLVTHACGLKQL
jgi:hypothetical protein